MLGSAASASRQNVLNTGHSVLGYGGSSSGLTGKGQRRVAGAQSSALAIQDRCCPPRIGRRQRRTGESVDAAIDESERTIRIAR